MYFFLLYDLNYLCKYPSLSNVPNKMTGPNIINLTWTTSNWQTLPKLKHIYGKLPEKDQSTRILKNP